jgi:hypothetical protein
VVLEGGTNIPDDIGRLLSGPDQKVIPVGRMAIKPAQELLEWASNPNNLQTPHQATKNPPGDVLVVALGRTTPDELLNSLAVQRASKLVPTAVVLV